MHIDWKSNEMHELREVARSHKKFGYPVQRWTLI